MEIGVADGVWEIEEFVSFVKRDAPTPNRPTTYKNALKKFQTEPLPKDFTKIMERVRQLYNSYMKPLDKRFGLPKSALELPCGPPPHGPKRGHCMPPYHTGLAPNCTIYFSSRDP